MRNLASTSVLLAAAIALSACGGSDNAAFVGTGTSTSGTTTGTGTTGTTTTPTYALGGGSGSSFKSGTLEITPTSIGAGGDVYKRQSPSITMGASRSTDAGVKPFSSALEYKNGLNPEPGWRRA